MAIIQQMFPVSADGSYWFGEYRPTTNTQNNNGDYSYYAQSVALDPEGSIYFGGSYYQHGTGYQGRFNRDYYQHFTKLTSSGDVIFCKRRQHADNVGANYEAMTCSRGTGDILICGSGSTKNSSGNWVQYDGLLFKWDKDGNYGWHRSLGNNSTDNEYDHYEFIDTDSSGNIYISGEGSYMNDLYENGSCTYHTSWISSNLLVKYNSGGTLQWKKEIRKGTGCHNNSYYTAYGMDINVSPNGNIYGAGACNLAKWPSGSSGGTPECGYSGQGFVMKLNSSGSIQWQRRIRSSHTISASPSSYTGCWVRTNFQSIGIDSNENVYCTGENWATSSANFGTYANYGAHLIKYNSSGSIQWQRNWHRPSGSSGGTGVNSAIIKFDADDNVYVCVRYSNDNPTIIHKWNSSGTHQWTRSIKRNNTRTGSSAYYAFVREFKIDKVRKAMIICGYFQHTGTDRYRSFIIRLPIDGSHTGTYGNWVYSNYSSEWTHSNTFAGNNLSITDTSGVLDIYSSSMVAREAHNSYNSANDHPIQKSSYNNA